MIYPEEFHSGLWGGEGVIKGLLKRPETRHRSFKVPPAKYFWPKLFEVKYSTVPKDQKTRTKRSSKLTKGYFLNLSRTADRNFLNLKDPFGGYFYANDTDF